MWFGAAMPSEGMPRVRADQLLFTRGLAESRSRAQALIMAGLVFAGDHRVAKAGEMLPEDAALIVKGRDHPWVGRGGVKLAHALAQFGWEDLAGEIVLDIGASTGGFTDVCLHHGAAQVFAVDVGHGQIDWRLRGDARVRVLEKTNARHLTCEQIDRAVPTMIVCDASFIGLATILPAPLALAAPSARLVALVKPQFEAGPGEVGKGGVVRDPEVHARVQREVAAFVEGEGWTVVGLTQSPITGPEGNIEFLLGARRG